MGRPPLYAMKMHRLNLYETASKFYLVGGDITEQKFKILKVDRGDSPGDLRTNEDDTQYTKDEVNHILNTVDHGNKASGGLRLKCNAWGLLGFIKFTKSFYMLFVTKRSQVALIGGHYVYQIDGTELVPLAPSSSARLKLDQDEEARFITILHNLDLSRSFYFSYSYDITHTLQYNILFQKNNSHEAHDFPQQHNSMFVWNFHLLKTPYSTLKSPLDWCLPVVHGFINQSCTFIIRFQYSSLNSLQLYRYSAGQCTLLLLLEDLAFSPARVF